MQNHIATISPMLGGIASIVAIYIFLTGNDNISNIDNNLGKEKIVGSWSESKASDILIKKMKIYFNEKYKFGDGFCSEPDEYGNCKLKHSIYNSFYVPYFSGEQSSIIIAYTQIIVGDGVRDCHACGVALSIFEFSKKKNNWILENEGINIANVGSYGNIPEIKAIEIGNNIFGVVIENGFFAQGQSESYTTIYSKIGSKYINIFSSTTSGYNEDQDQHCSNWQATIKFDKQGSSFYDLSIIKKGIIETEGSCKKTNEKITYKFDGKKYSASTVYQ